MKKLVFIFPGQASQYVGMGRDLYDHSPAARAVMDHTASMEGLNGIPDLCFSGPEELLTSTDNVQPAITTISLMALEAIKEALGNKVELIKPVACAGHSLGEYAAHYAAGNLSLKQTLELVTWRGRWMNEASQQPHPEGAMVAVMGLSLEQTLSVVDQVGADRLAVANLNSPGQIILSGERAAVEAAIPIAGKLGAKRTVILKVSGAWHSPLMKPAQARMAELLAGVIAPDRVSFNPAIPVIANATAETVKSVAELCETLTRQITSPVKWEACVQALVHLASEVNPETAGALGGLCFVEIGPNKVLKGLLRNIDRNLEVMNVEDMAGVKALLEALSP